MANIPPRLRDSRIEFAHQLPQPSMNDSKDPFDMRVRRWMALSRLTTWLIRVLLLLHVGVDSGLLREKCLEHQRFAFYRVNLDKLVLELGWEPPSEAQSK